MEDFWPTTATGWLGLMVASITLFGSVFGGFGYLLNKHVTEPINNMRRDMKDIQTSHTDQLNSHATRLNRIERKVFPDEH